MFFKAFLIVCLINLIVAYPVEEFNTSNYTKTLEKLTAGLTQLNHYDIQPRIMQDAYLTTPQLLKKYGYPVEIHTVHTPDGYILEMHRIPKVGATPVYLQHGIMDSSAGWVIMGPSTALAYYLYDLGYDVWMGNIRGNRYSRKHSYLDVESKEYWDFSFHEIGMFDVPSMLDYVIEKSGYPKVHYVGHSQGTTSFWVMCSMRPGYCDKVISMQAMAPIAFLKHVKSPLIKAVAPFVSQLDWITDFLGMHEFLPNNDLLTMGGQLVCKEQAITQAICSNAIFLVTGFNSEQMNKTMLPAILGHVPAGSSTKQFIHFGQMVNSGRFRLFDYGFFKNIFKYGSFKPPSYDLSKITAPVALHYSMNDWLADIKDVQKLQEFLPNVIKRVLVPQPKFNHLDFIIAIDSRKLAHEQVVKSMKDVEAKIAAGKL